MIVKPEIDLEKLSTESIKKGSKSFAFSGLLLPKETRSDVFRLYQWCRYCDDQIDEVQSDGMQNDDDSKNKVFERLQHLKEQTQRAFSNPDMVKDPEFMGLAEVVHKHLIPFHYAQQLLAGMEMDALGTRYNSLPELELYCYRVAGVVGLMMAHILGVTEPRALKHACDMGIAMQMTNIARDVFTDADKGRLYLPMIWLKDVDLKIEQMNWLANRKKLVSVAERLIDEAEKYYVSGDEGLEYLSFRNALAIRSARSIYSAIGREVKNKNDLAWKTRAHTSKLQKIALLGQSVSYLLRNKSYAKAFARCKFSMDDVWRFQ